MDLYNNSFSIERWYNDSRCFNSYWWQYPIIEYINNTLESLIGYLSDYELIEIDWDYVNEICKNFQYTPACLLLLNLTKYKEIVLILPHILLLENRKEQNTITAQICVLKTVIDINGECWCHCTDKKKLYSRLTHTKLNYRLVLFILAKCFINNKINKIFIDILCRVESIWRKVEYGYRYDVI